MLTWGEPSIGRLEPRAVKGRLENGRREGGSPTGNEARIASKISKEVSEGSKAFSRKYHTTFPCNLVTLPFNVPSIRYSFL